MEVGSRAGRGRASAGADVYAGAPWPRGAEDAVGRSHGPPAPPASFSRATPRAPGGRGRCEPKPQKKGAPGSHAAALNRATAPPGNVGQYLRHCGLSRGGRGGGGVDAGVYSTQQGTIACGASGAPGLRASDPRVTALPRPRFRLLSLRLRPGPAPVCLRACAATLPVYT